MKGEINITNLTKVAIPAVPFASMKEEILGKKYNLSLVFISNKKSKELNNSYRQKNNPTNVLSFPLNKENGEIFITPEVSRKEAPKFGKNYTNFVGFLFIHGCLHLKGMEHGSTMERMEKKLQKQFLV